jgi:sporulation protein YlmC with PRC-barrel domain
MTQERKLNRMIRAAFVPVVGLCLAGPVWAAGDGRPGSAAGTGAQTTAQQQAAQPLRASEIMGTDVHNLQGEKIGEVGDIVVDISNGEAPYALIAYDPGLLRGERFVAVPLKSLRITNGSERIALDATPGNLEQRAVGKDEWRTALSDAQRENFHAIRTSDMIGKNVKNRQGDNIGEIQDVMVDLSSQKVQHVVLEVDRGLTTPDRHVAVPISAFGPAEGDDQLALNVSAQELQAMPTVERSSATGAGRVRGIR